MKKRVVEREFVVALTEHRVFGHILVPYFVEPNESNTFYTISEVITKQDVLEAPNNYSVPQKKLIEIIDKYSDESLARKFSKKQGSKEFFHKMEPAFFEGHISPFIDKQIVECIEIIRKNDFRLYFKPAKYNNVYDEDRIEISSEYAHPTFRFDLNKEGLKYSLNIEHKGEPLKIRFKNPIILTDSPCRMVLHNELISFENLLGKRLKPFLSKDFVKIPLSVAEKYMRTFVYGIVCDHDVIPRGFNVVDVESDKKAILSLERGLDFEPILVLKFQYGNKCFDAGRAGKVEVEFKKVGERFVFYKHKRDSEWEKSVLDFFKKNNMLLSGSHMVFSKKGNPFGDEFKYAAINWLNDNKDQLEEQGIIIEQNIEGQTYCIGNQQFDVSLKMEDDWFDLYAVVRFGEFEIPFIRLKRNILNGKREFILPNGEIAILPIEWFVKYKDLIPFASTTGDNYRFAKHHFNLISETVKEIDTDIVEKMEQLHPSEFKVIDEPEGLNATLRQYQKEGFSWMTTLAQNGFGGCLADDMGLGKTLQTLTLLLNNKKTAVEELVADAEVPEGQLFPQQTKAMPASLIIVPTSLVHNWENEIKKFTPQLKVYKHLGTQRKRIANLQGIVDYYDIIITTYGTIRNDYEMLSEILFDYLILDESQYIKNSESKTYQAVGELQARHKLVLTGTPIENSLSDLWSQINFLNPGLLGSLNFFKKEYIHNIERLNDEEKQKQLYKLIMPFILRRTKEEVAKDLPPKMEYIRYCSMTDDQSSIYEEQKSVIRNSLLENIEKHGSQKSTFLALQGLTKLRQLANHPRLMKGNEGSSGKFEEVLRSMENLIAEKHKVLMFSSFVTHLEIFQEEFEKRGWGYHILTGNTRDRESVIKDFQENDKKQIFLISLKAGGVGLNLTSADYIFILDPWWNPAAENQAINRAHRIGQDKKVFVYRFITEESIEEKIQLLKERKAALADLFIQSNNPFTSISTEEMVELFS